VPIYEYQCEHCEHKMEAIQKFNDDPLKECPECNQKKLRKLVSAAAFKLKGSGWYETDFKDKKLKVKEDGKSTKNKDSDKTDGTRKSGEKSDSKTVTKKKKLSAASSSD